MQNRKHGENCWFDGCPADSQFTKEEKPRNVTVERRAGRTALYPSTSEEGKD